MPEVLTKHPDVVRSLLVNAGGKCGAGQTPKILKACPSDQFCTMPGGELCIYGLGQARSMTQISPAELGEQVCTSEASAAPAEAGSCGAACGVAAPEPVDLGLAALLLGALWARRARLSARQSRRGPIRR